MGALGATTAFIGRARELGVLEAALDDARAGRASTVLVCGEAGLGKSRLVAEFAARARSAGARVLVGGCLPMGQSLPFTAVIEALRALVAEVGVDPLRRMVGDLGTELRRLLPALGPAPATSTADAGAAQARLFEAVLGLLLRLGRDRPHVLVLEDVHWADPSTRDLLLFLAHNLRDAAVVLVATLRDDEVDAAHPLRPVPARLARDDRARRIDLAPLTRADVARLLEGLLAAPPRRELVDLVVARAQGNPFFVEELAAAGTRPGLSATLRDVLLASVESLPDDTRRVLRLAAAAGRRVPHDLLARAGELGDAALEAALRPAVDRRVLVVDPDADTYAFRHDLLAEAVESTLLPGERRRLHRTIAEVLAADPTLATRTPAAELAHHWHLAGDRPRALAASHDAAREAAALHATGEALSHVDRLVELWDQVPDAPDLTGMDRAGVLAWQADLAHDAGQVRRAVEIMRTALDVVPDGSTAERLGGMWERLARFVSSADGYAVAMPDVERAVALVADEPPSRTRARVRLMHAHALWEVDPDRGLAIAREELETVTALGDRELEGIARTFVGTGLAATGHLDAGVEHLRAAVAIAEARGGAEDLARALNLLSGVLIRGGRASEGASVSLDGLDRIRALGVDRVWGPLLAGNATSGLFWAGRWGEAEALVDEAVGDGIGVGWLLLLQARLRAHRGRVDDAREALAEADRHGNTTEPRRLAIALGIELVAGDLDAAHGLVVRRHEFPAPTHAATAAELAAWALRVEADRVAAGEVEASDARSLADELLAEADHPNRAGVVHAEPQRHTARAEHARLTGAVDAVEAWREAVESWESLGWVPPLAYARFRLAEALVDGGASSDGEVDTLLRLVHATAVELGAAPLQDDVARLARRIGASGLPGRSTGPREAGDHPRGLTPREQEVLELVVAGATNPEVGRALHISGKTASVHVSNILRKLEVTTRTEAAAVAVREGLTGA